MICHCEGLRGMAIYQKKIETFDENRLSRNTKSIECKGNVTKLPESEHVACKCLAFACAGLTADLCENMFR